MIKNIDNWEARSLILTQQEIEYCAELEEGIFDNCLRIHLNHFFCSTEKALELSVDIPDHIEMRQLTKDHAPEIFKTIPYLNQDVENYIHHVVDVLPSGGAFKKESGELMGWILNYTSESHNQLWVKPENRRQGLAKLLVGKMTRDRAIQGKPSHCIIVADNVASEKTFRAVGFEKDYELFVLSNRKNTTRNK